MLRGILSLQLHTHDRYGRLDLMDPRGIIIHGFLALCFHIRHIRLIYVPQLPEHPPVVLLHRIPILRQAVKLQPYILQGTEPLPVLPCISVKTPPDNDKRGKKTQRRRIQHRLCLQII